MTKKKKTKTKVPIKPLPPERLNPLKKLQEDPNASGDFKLKIGQLVNYTPVNKSHLTEGYTVLSVIPYCRTTGLIMRSARKTQIVGYCVENPVQVLESVFPNYNVTRFYGFEFFDSSDFKKTTPMIGLGIDSYPMHRGIKGTLDELLVVEDVDELRRDQPIQKNVLKRIKKNLRKHYKHQHAVLRPSYKQMKYDIERMIRVLESSRK
jgi:hypothetical protein